MVLNAITPVTSCTLASILFPPPNLIIERLVITINCPLIWHQAVSEEVLQSLTVLKR